jgi:solute carrier family 25 protein 39/40
MQGPAAAQLLQPVTQASSSGSAGGVMGIGRRGLTVAAAAGSALRLALAEEVKAGGVASLWRGVIPTLWRDVPFSMVYWLGYERVREAAMHVIATSKNASSEPHSVTERFAVSFLAGAASGSIAAALTTPLDVVKTRVQVQTYELQQLARPGTAAVRDASRLKTTSTMTVLRRIVAEEGAGALFSGLGARLAKVAPACAIMISSYEVCKLLLGERLHAH